MSDKFFSTVAVSDFCHSTNYSAESTTFDIRDYLDRLEKSPKSKSKYFCPVCSGSNLDINLKSGEYRCFSNECTSRDIREAIAPWADSPRNRKNSGQKHYSQKPEPKTIPQPALIPGTVDLAIFTPTDFPEVRGGKVIYPYSDRQWVERVNLPDGGKKILPFHSGSEKAGKGDEPWPMYRESEAIAHGLGKFVAMAEGEKCVESLRSIGVVSTTFQGGSWTEHDIESAILRLKKEGVAGIAYFPDNDDAGFKKAEKVRIACAKWAMPYVGISPGRLGITTEKGDIHDYIKEKTESGMTPEQVRENLEKIFRESADEKRSINQRLMEIIHPIVSDAAESTPPLTKKPDSQWADEIASDNLDRLAWDEEIKEWREYDSGKWKIISPLKISAVIKERFASEGKGFGIARINSIQNILKINLFAEKFDGNADLIPFADGVYSLSENKLLPHSPDYKLTWQLPHSFENESNKWEKIDNWLTFATKGNQRDKNILIAFAAATLKGKSDLQKFLLLLGIGGSGKGTYIRLLEDLVGAENSYSSSLVTWNSNQFESANGYGKRLVSFPDEIGKISNIEGLKKLTGGDSIRFEEKGKKATNYRFTGMVVIAANDSPFVGDSVSAIARRQIEIGFTNAVASRDRRNLNKEFKPELPAFSRYLLGLPDEWIEKHLRGGDSFGGALTSQSWENRCKVESIAGWLDEWAIFGDFTTPIGNTKAAIDAKYDDCKSLYESYTLYCSQNNQAPKSLRRFSGDLIEIATVIGKNLFKTHTRSGKVIKGLRLRMDHLDATIPTFTEILASAEKLDADVTATDVTVTDVTVTDVTVTDVTDIVTDIVTDTVTDETLAVQGCDGCDGLSPQILKDYQLTETDSKIIASDLLRATKDDDIEIFNLLKETYNLTNSLSDKERVWGCMSRAEQSLIRDFISRHK